MNTAFPETVLDVDVCVIGGGMSGLCAAIAAARRGASTVLVHDRPVLGGNASSEVRMWICGAHGDHNKESGILEEILLEHAYRNPSGNFSIWDNILYEKAAFQPNLQLLLNTTCLDAQTSNGAIEHIKAWQLTSQRRFTIGAKYFIDCSGDSVLAPPTGAAARRGRESCREFDEDIQPANADDKTMGNSLLIQLRRTDSPQPFTPPVWAYRFDSPDDLPYRMRGVNGANFWWIELGGLQDTIHDAEDIRDDLMRAVWGVWDYIKNRAPERDDAENWAVEWVGSLPGKRENRRYEGPRILTQNDIRDGGQFADTVAYGGWSMDDHHPAGLLYPGKPTIFHPAPSPYGIPLSTLYSRNIRNLFFAGRNISVTHAALSSTRVMATCSIIGQAAGTAAALCVDLGCDPESLTPDQISLLQRQLMDDDSWLPGYLRPLDQLTAAGSLTGTGDGVDHLHDGLDRDRPDESHAWVTGPNGTATITWDSPVQVGGARLVFDSNLRDTKRMPCSFPLKGDRSTVPGSLVKAFRIEAQLPDGSWETAYSTDNNYHRLVQVPIDRQAQALRLVPEASWGKEELRVFGFEATETYAGRTPRIAPGPTLSTVRSLLDPADLAPPESGLEDPDARPRGSA